MRFTTPEEQRRDRREQPIANHLSLLTWDNCEFAAVGPCLTLGLVRELVMAL
jgi:hypothetical protein